MKADSLHRYKNPPVKKKISPSIFVNAQKHKNRRLQRINVQDRQKKKMDPERERELRLKNRKDRIKSTITSVMFSILLIFMLLYLFYWAAVK